MTYLFISFADEDFIWRLTEIVYSAPLNILSSIYIYIYIYIYTSFLLYYKESLHAEKKQIYQHLKQLHSNLLCGHLY